MIELLNQWSMFWFEFVFPRMVDFSIVFLLVGAAWLIVRRKASCQFGYCLFMLVLLKLALPGFISMDLISTPQLSQHAVEYSGDLLDWNYTEHSEGEESVTLHPSKTDHSPVQPTERSNTISIPISTLLFSVYSLVVLFLSIRFGWSLYKSGQMVRQSKSVDTKALPLNLNRLVKQANIRRNIDWRTATWVKSPFVAGIFRPKILLPVDIHVNFTPSQLRWILLHELAHIKRWDGLTVLLQHIVQIVFFFHPFVWWSNKIIEELREFACDDFALAVSKSSHKDCGEGFLGIVFESNNLPHLLPATLGLTNYKIVVRRRLMRIMNKTRTLRRRLSLQSALYLLLIAFFVIPLSLQNAFAQMGGWKGFIPILPAQIAQELLFTDSGQRLGESASNGVALGDIDGDGDLDAFVTNGRYPGQPDTVWINEGDGFFTDSGQRLEGTESWEPVLEDLDGDGDLDAFVAVADGPNRVWLNDGNGTFTDSGQRIGNQESHGVALGDLDGDGDLDAFVANISSQPDAVWLNDGSGIFTDSGQSLGSETSNDVALGDLDGDGDLDAFVAITSDFSLTNRGTGEPNEVWLNDGNGTFTDSGQALGNSRSHEVVIRDLDGDGDLDAFIVNEDSTRPAPNEIWLNDGNGTFTDSGLKMGVRDSNGLALGDLDGDGDLDAFVANFYDEANWVWFNDTPPTSIFGWRVF